MDLSSESALRDEICRVAASLFQRGYVHATAGNISARLEDGFLITPTDACLGFLDPARLAKVDPGGRQLSGDRASKTLALHRHIYAADTQARCVIHTHSTHLVALSMSRELAAAGVADGAVDSDYPDLLPPITPYFVMKVGHVPLIPYHRPGDPQVGARVEAAIRARQAGGGRLRAVMLARLGPKVWHDSPAAAMATLEELEETARLWMLLDPKPAPLGAAALDELRRAFGADW